MWSETQSVENEGIEKSPEEITYDAHSHTAKQEESETESRHPGGKTR